MMESKFLVGRIEKTPPRLSKAEKRIAREMSFLLTVLIYISTLESGREETAREIALNTKQLGGTCLFARV